ASHRADTHGSRTLAYQCAASELVASAVSEEPHGGAVRECLAAGQVRLAPGGRVAAYRAAHPDAGTDCRRHLVHEGRAAVSGLGARGSAGGLPPALAGVGTADPALSGTDEHPAALCPVVLLGIRGVLDGADGVLPAAQGARPLQHL